MDYLLSTRFALQYILDETRDHPNDSLKDIINEAMELYSLPIVIDEDWFVRVKYI